MREDEKEPGLADTSLPFQSARGKSKQGVPSVYGTTQMCQQNQMCTHIATFIRQLSLSVLSANLTQPGVTGEEGGSPEGLPRPDRVYGLWGTVLKVD